ncbi:hypothetical protein [Lacticaseibacillus jixiensis]|uniref:hypothetical protein n=1 Tax=Lacticaseibacillus jixiensis TaxID=3231926 RepID=UPI0036F24C3F
MVTKAAKQLLSGIVDRPKNLWIVNAAGVVVAQEVLLIRVFSVAMRRRQIENAGIETVGLAVTPELMAAEAPIRYANEIAVQGRLQQVLVVTHPAYRGQVEQVFKAGRAKILQLQATWSAHYLGKSDKAVKIAKQLAAAVSAWPMDLSGLDRYQRRAKRVVRTLPEAALVKFAAMQAHQRKLYRQTLDAVADFAVPLVMITKPTKRVYTTPLFGRMQRPRAAVDKARLQDPAYLHQQAQEIMLDYQYDQAHHLPLAAKGIPLSAAELAKWQRTVDAQYYGQGA